MKIVEVCLVVVSAMRWEGEAVIRLLRKPLKVRRNVAALCCERGSPTANLTMWPIVVRPEAVSSTPALESMPCTFSSTEPIGLLGEVSIFFRCCLE